MRIPILTFVFDRKKVATRDKEGVVELRITYDRARKYISTGVRLLPKEWNGVVIRREDCLELQESLDILMRNTRKVLNMMMEEGCIDLDDVPKRLEELAGSKKLSFIDYMRQRTEIRKYGRSPDTCQRYDRFIKFFTSWGHIKSFRDITDANILLLDKALKKNGMKNYSKWNNYHRFLNSFIMDAMDDGLLKRNPYKWVHIPKDKSSRLDKYLTPEEFQRLQRKEMPTKSLERVRDLFVFQTYTCMSYVDLASFDARKVVQNTYTAMRVKTGKEFTFILLKPAREILCKYKGRLPIISNVKYDLYLKAVAQTAGIDKPLSSHWARHTGATLLLNNGNIPMEVIRKILGHSSTRETEKVYAQVLDNTIADAMMAFDETL